MALAVLFGLSSTALHYCNIPEVYPMWLLPFMATLLALWRRNAYWSIVWFALSFLAYVQTILLLPAFLIWGWRKGVCYGIAAVGLSLALLLITLQATGVSLMANLLRERVYLEIASQDPLWLKSNLVALRQSGAIIPLLLSIPLMFVTKPSRAKTFILLVLLPNLLFALVWVNNHGAFFWPTALTASVLLSLQLSAIKNYRAILAVAIIMSLSTLPWAWDEATYDRRLGELQYEFCHNAFAHVQENGLISTALYPRWQYIYSLNQNNTDYLTYSPWAFVKSQEHAMAQVISDLGTEHKVTYADYTVHPGILAQLDPVPVYTHAGILPNGDTVTLTLFRVTAQHIEQQPE